MRKRDTKKFSVSRRLPANATMVCRRILLRATVKIKYIGNKDVLGTSALVVFARYVGCEILYNPVQPNSKQYNHFPPFPNFHEKDNITVSRNIMITIDSTTFTLLPPHIFDMAP